MNSANTALAAVPPDNIKSEFYESFWKDHEYTFNFAIDSAVRDRFPAIEKVWGSLPRPKTVLDYGSGNGVLTYWLACNDFGKNFIGMDISQTGVQYANQKFGSAQLKFEVLNTRLPKLGGHYDCCVSSHVLEHIENPENALAQIAGCADWYALEVPLEECLSQRVKYWGREHTRKNNELGHVNFWSAATFDEFLKKSGYRVFRSHQYAAGPNSPYYPWWRRTILRTALALLGIELYGKIFGTHYIVLARYLPQV